MKTHVLGSLFKKRSQHSSFPVNIARFLRTLILEKTCEWLLLHVNNSICFNVYRILESNEKKWTKWVKRHIQNLVKHLRYIVFCENS